MTAKIEIRRGRTLLVPGTWESGDPFTSQTSLSCELIKNGIVTQVQVNKLTDREFEIYASNLATTNFEVGLYDAILTRTDAEFFPNGDDFVDGLEPFQIQVI